MAESPRDLSVGPLVHRSEAVHGFVGEDNSPAKGVGWPVAFDDGDVPRRILPLEQDREVESGGTTTQAYDSHWLPPGRRFSSSSIASSFLPVSSASAASRRLLSRAAGLSTCRRPGNACIKL